LKYDALIITNLPNYYKVNLFNEISQDCKLLVVFIAAKESSRNADFLRIGVNNRFQYVVLNASMEKRNLLFSCFRLLKIIKNHSFKKLILGEWVNLEYWFALLFFRKVNTMLILESNIHSVPTLGLKEVAKRIFLSRINKVFASGIKHKLLLKLLNYKREIAITNGVGLIGSLVRKPTKASTNSFLYVGRLAPEKNLRMLIEIFNDLSYELNIIGEGPEEGELKKMAKSNINFLGYVKNVDLSIHYQTHKALLLISKNEPWGLVAEESLYFGTPVIVSSVCGVVDSLCFNKKNSLIVNAGSKKEIIDAVNTMMDDNVYEELKNNWNSSFIEEKNKKQVEIYVQSILS